MSCNCKNNPIKELREKSKSSNKILNYSINIIIYLLTLSISAIIVIPFLAVMLFRLIVLGNSEMNISMIISKIFKSRKFKKKEIDEENEDEDDEDDDEYVDIFENVEVLDNNFVSK